MHQPISGLAVSTVRKVSSAMGAEDLELLKANVFFGCVVKSWCCFPIDICRETSFKIVQLILKKKMQAASAALEAGKRRKALAKSVASTSASGSASSVPSSDGSGGKRTRGEVLATPSTKVTPDAKVTCERGAVVTPCALNFDENTGLSNQNKKKLSSDPRHDMKFLYSNM